MRRPADQEMTYRFYRGHITPFRATLGSTRVGQEVEGVRKNMGKSLYCVFAGRNGQGRQKSGWA
jgi:hypothetical protein